MHAKIRSLFILTAVLALAFAGISPALADDNPPPADAADIITLQRVLDLYPGSTSSDPSYLVSYNGSLYFSAEINNGFGRELWRLGDSVPMDIYPGPIGSNPTHMTVFNGRMYFAADGNDGAGRELWSYDPLNGLVRATDIIPGSSHSVTGHLEVYDGALYFNAVDGAGAELWRYDPINGAVLAADITSGPLHSYPKYMTALDGTLYFAAISNDGAGEELWRYDPLNGASRAADICSGNPSSYPESLVAYSGAVYFAASGCDGMGTELWKYDPLNGAQIVADISNGPTSSSPLYGAVYNGALYFYAWGSAGVGPELWKYDPANGAERVVDTYPGAAVSAPTHLAVHDGALYFSANGNDGAGRELWKYDNSTRVLVRPARSLEGWVLETGENSNAGGVINSNLPTFNLGDNAQDRQFRSILSFDTSILPDQAVIISVRLHIHQQGVVGTNPFTTHGNILIDIIKGAFGGNNALQAADFQAAPGRAKVAIIRNLPDGNMWYNTLFSRTAHPYINRTGVTQLRLRFARDDNNDNGADFLRFFSADSSSINDYPVLEVRYYIP